MAHPEASGPEGAREEEVEQTKKTAERLTGRSARISQESQPYRIAQRVCARRLASTFVSVRLIATRSRKPA